MKKFRMLRMADCDKQTINRIVFDQFGCYALELPWKDNQREISRIKPGLYPVTHQISPNFGSSLRLHDVPGRSNIVIHIGNYVGSLNPRTGKPDSLGCPIPGMKLKDLDGDGVLDVSDSRKAVDACVKHFLEGEYTHVEVSDRLLRTYSSEGYKEFAKVEGMLI